MGVVSDNIGLIDTLFTIGYIHVVQQETQCIETRVKCETANRCEYIQLCITECIEAMFNIYRRSGHNRAASSTYPSRAKYLK